MIRSKKAWLRILEATIAIILIASVVMVIFLRQSSPQNIRDEIFNVENIILSEIAQNDELRQQVLNSNEEEIRNFISQRIPSNLNFTLKICNIGDHICGLPSLKNTYTNKEIYTQQVVITSTLQEYDPKKIKLFVWVK